MSAALLDGSIARWRHRYAGSWAASLALHGLVGGVMAWFITASMPVPPVIEAPFRWDVALVSASISAAAPLTTPVSAAKSSAAKPMSTPAESTAAGSNPVAETTPLSAPPVSTVTSEPVTQPSVTSSAMGHEMPGTAVASASVSSEEVAAPASTEAPPVVANASPNPAGRAVNMGELGDLLWRRMEELKRYPYLARRNGWEGKVLIRVVLGGDGRLLHAEIQESSGYQVLDQDALRVLHAAAPLKVDPNSTWQQQATFTLPVAYRLQR